MLLSKPMLFPGQNKKVLDSFIFENQLHRRELGMEWSDELRLVISLSGKPDTAGALTDTRGAAVVVAAED